MDTAGAGVVAAHSGLHAIDEVCGLVHITGEMHPKATVQLHAQGHRRPAQDDLVLVIEVVGVGLPVHFEIRQLPLPLGGEEHPDGEVVYVGGRLTGTRGDGGVGHLAVEFLEVPRRRLPMSRPSFVAQGDALQELLGGHGSPQSHKLLPQGLVFAAPHLVELDLVDHTPLRAVRGTGGLDARELPEITGEGISY